jgi:DHA1 family multidrug resistance protein-like MFS transporter
MNISWKRNFFILWIAELVAIIGFQAIQPFLPYYIQQLDVDSLEEALIWAGYMGTAGGLSMAVASPFWGVLADRFGRKPMVVRAMFGGGVALILMVYATTAGQVLVVRTLQGFLSGTVTACITLVSTSTPRRHQGFALGMMQGAFMLGASVGPFIGGPSIEYMGYQNSFLVAGVLVILAGLVTQFWVKEDFTPQPPKPNRVQSGIWTDAKQLMKIRSFMLVIIAVTLVYFSFGVIMPVIPLFIQDLAGHDDILSVAGQIFALTSLVGAAAGVLVGRMSDRWGAQSILTVSLFVSALFYLAEGFSTSVFMLGSLIVLSGISTGAIRPVTNALVTRVVPEADRGKAFGVVTSAGALGFALGPVSGGYIAAIWGFRAVFVLTSVLFVGVGLWVLKAMVDIDKESEV